MKALIVFSEEPGEYIGKAGDILTKKGYEVGIVNLSKPELSDENAAMYVIKNFEPDLVVSFNLAGYSYRLLGDDLFFNSLCCPLVNVILGDKPEYDDRIGLRVNYTCRYIFQNKEYARWAAELKRTPMVGYIENHEIKYIK